MDISCSQLVLDLLEKLATFRESGRGLILGLEYVGALIKVWELCSVQEKVRVGVVLLSGINYGPFGCRNLGRYDALRDIIGLDILIGA